MIRGLHGLFYSSREEDTRAFLRDKLKLPHTDVGGGWLIFDLPEADLGCHPTEGQPKPGTHDLSFFCDDIHGTVKELQGRGVKFDDEIADHGYGFVTHFQMPGEIRVQLYEPKYAKLNQTWGAGAKAAARTAATKKTAAPRKAAAPAKKGKPAPKKAPAPAARAKGAAKKAAPGKAKARR